MKKKIKKDVKKKRRVKVVKKRSVNKSSRKKVVKRKSKVVKKKISKIVKKRKVVRKKIKVVKKKVVKKIRKSKVRKKIVRKKVSKKAVKKVSKKSVKTRNIKISSGIPGLDKLIEGGYEPRSINLVMGDSGSGKSIVAMHFIIEGIKRGEVGLYITFEETREEFYKNMLDMGWDLEKLERSGKFIFLEYSPEKIKMTLDEGGGTIESIIIKSKIKRIVVDSISSFSLMFDDELTKRRANLAFFDLIRKWGCTGMLTLQKTPTLEKHRKGQVLPIEFEVDGVILLHFIRTKKGRERFIEILKMRGVKHSTNVHAYEINKGIKIKGKKSLG